MEHFWIKDQTRKEIITKTQIPSKGNFNIYANYYNLMDVKGIGLQFSSNSNIQIEKLYRKNGFEYIVLEHNNLKELFILPNDKIVKYANRIATKIDICTTEEEVISLLIDEMN